MNDVYNALDGDQFQACFIAWVEGLCEAEGEIIAIDGKTSRRTGDRRRGRDPLHLVSAWASGQRLVLGQQAVAEGSNEITAIPALLEKLASSLKPFKRFPWGLAPGAVSSASRPERQVAEVKPPTDSRPICVIVRMSVSSST